MITYQSRVIFDLIKRYLRDKFIKINLPIMFRIIIFKKYYDNSIVLWWHHFRQNILIYFRILFNF